MVNFSLLLSLPLRTWGNSRIYSIWWRLKKVTFKRPRTGSDRQETLGKQHHLLKLLLRPSNLLCDMSPPFQILKQTLIFVLKSDLSELEKKKGLRDLCLALQRAWVNVCDTCWEAWLFLRSGRQEGKSLPQPWQSLLQRSVSASLHYDIEYFNR